jgi:hypothetical protein
MEVVSRFPGGLDFGRGLVDVNVRLEIPCSFSENNNRPRTQFTMWPLFQCLNIDNILTICEVCISPSLFKELTCLTSYWPARTRSDRACSVPIPAPSNAWRTCHLLHFAVPICKPPSRLLFQLSSILSSCEAGMVSHCPLCEYTYCDTQL